MITFLFILASITLSALITWGINYIVKNRNRISFPKFQLKIPKINFPKFFLKKEDYVFWSGIWEKISPSKNVQEDIELECVNGVYQRVKKEEKKETKKSGGFASKDILMIVGVVTIGMVLLWYFKKMKR